MKKNGNWWCVDSVGLAGDFMRLENFSCIQPINEAVKYCKQFRNAIDAGTWIGDSTVQMAPMFDRVIGFEPHPLVFVCCEKNLKDRDITNVEMYNYALSNENKLMNLYNGKSTFSGWVSEKEEVPELVTVHNEQQVQTIVLDSYHFEDIDFIKLDCDSHEGYILAGAEKFFKTNSPVVLIENKLRILKDRQPADMPNAIELLESYGYVLRARVEKNDYVYTKGEADAE
jgi:FkbM family methyltransferase